VAGTGREESRFRKKKTSSSQKKTSNETICRNLMNRNVGEAQPLDEEEEGG
jgi:hypothetical protein